MQILTRWTKFRSSPTQVRNLRVVKNRLPYTLSDLLRACVAAIISDRDRAAILRILKRHIPEAVSSLVLGHWSFA